MRITLSGLGNRCILLLRTGTVICRIHATVGFEIRAIDHQFPIFHTSFQLFADLMATSTGRFFVKLTSEFQFGTCVHDDTFCVVLRKFIQKLLPYCCIYLALPIGGAAAMTDRAPLGLPAFSVSDANRDLLFRWL